ncbi:hypothetical protein DF22_001733 [Xylella fastidiosa]|nr:hypothetical protein M233_03205 [Xylella fastidiosa subsp. multiplex Griffin-1]KFA41736.1 hypothetical protein DF22_001733 [Xylella fastidiosa]OMJ99988.1 hypothetical protein XYFPCFBP8417_04955 [Xylella fastidiosa subsp. multiplex]
MEQGFEHVLEYMALATVQVDLAVDGVENGCDLALFPSIPGNRDQQRIKMLLFCSSALAASECSAPIC